MSVRDQAHRSGTPEPRGRRPPSMYRPVRCPGDAPSRKSISPPPALSRSTPAGLAPEAQVWPVSLHVDTLRIRRLAREHRSARIDFADKGTTRFRASQKWRHRLPSLAARYGARSAIRKPAMTQPRFFPEAGIDSSPDRLKSCVTRLFRGRSSSAQARTLSQRDTGFGIILLICVAIFLAWVPLPVAAETEGDVEAGIAAFEAGRFGEAYNELKPAAEAGDADAQLYLAKIYGSGLSVPKDLSIANEWLRRSAIQGNIRAIVALGYVYSNGIGVSEDKERAFKLYRKAAQKGDPVAQSNIGLMYQYGEGVDFDALMAARWYERAAAQGDPVAQTHLGQLTWMGTGEVTRDRRRALRLLRAAAEQDHAHGQYLYCANQTELYGPGSPELVEALKWCKLAADQGYPKGERTWEAADRWFLSPEQKTQAEKRAAEWSRRHR